MKNAIISTVCTAFLAAGMLPSVPASASSESAVCSGIFGDADHNGCVDVADAQHVLISYVNALAQGEKIPAADDPDSDVNFDGLINVKDANIILRHYCESFAGNEPLWSVFLASPDLQKIGGFSLPVSTEAGFQDALKQSMIIEIGTARGKAGETVTVPVYISGVPILAGFQLYMESSSALSLLDLRSDFASQLILNADSSYVRNLQKSIIVWSSDRGDNLLVKDGSVLCELIYQIPEDAAAGTVYPVTLDPDTMFVTVSDETEHEIIPFTASESEQNEGFLFMEIKGAVIVA
ncbi:MAG: hypothetical protein IKI77_00335 [Oscillospiraceae bacterium]|nr:hypothetical protein [Oscillospiraceae bacterium]